MSFGAKRLCDPELIRERSIMREHLFRGKLKNKEKWMDKGEWIEGSLLCYDVEGMIACRIIESLLTGGREARAIAYEVDPETVCQYTGLADKNGRKIFEGDIIEIRNKKRHFLSQIEWDCTCGGFLFRDTKEGSECGLDAITPFGIYGAVKVIGNIFDNKELME